MTLCTRCPLPSTKSDLSFDSEGVCLACKAFENRKAIDSDSRANEFQRVMNRYAHKDVSKSLSE